MKRTIESIESLMSALCVKDPGSLKRCKQDGTVAAASAAKMYRQKRSASSAMLTSPPPSKGGYLMRPPRPPQPKDDAIVVKFLADSEKKIAVLKSEIPTMTVGALRQVVADRWPYDSHLLSAVEARMVKLFLVTKFLVTKGRGAPTITITSVALEDNAASIPIGDIMGIVPGRY